MRHPGGEPAVDPTLGEGVLGGIGATPLLRLSRVLPGRPVELFAKVEGANPGGSMKDRAAAGALIEAMRRGDIGPDTVVIESSSGNMAIGLAQACSYLGLRLICVLDARATRQNRAILRAYGAEVEILDRLDPSAGDLLSARLHRVRQLSAEIPNSYWVNQYANHDVTLGYHALMREALDAMGRAPDYLFVPVSTCGLLRGCVEYVHQRRLPTVVVAVDAVGSVIFGGRPRPRLLPGHGAAVRPALFGNDLADGVVQVTDLDCVRYCHRLARTEGVLAGASSGAVIAAVDRYRGRMPVGATCLAVLPDRGERYLDTIFEPEWIARHFGCAAIVDTTETEEQPA